MLFLMRTSKKELLRYHENRQCHIEKPKLGAARSLECGSLLPL